MEQKRPADIIQELLDYLWNGLGLEEKGWKRLKKGDFKKKMKNGLTYQIWFDRSRYNYIDYEIGHGNVEVGFSCIIKQGDDYLYSFRIEPTTGGSFFRMLTEDLRLNTGLLDTFLPLVKANYPRGMTQKADAPFPCPAWPLPEMAPAENTTCWKMAPLDITAAKGRQAVSPRAWMISFPCL